MGIGEPCVISSSTTKKRMLFVECLDITAVDGMIKLILMNLDADKEVLYMVIDKLCLWEH